MYFVITGIVEANPIVVYDYIVLIIFHSILLKLKLGILFFDFIYYINFMFIVLDAIDGAGKGFQREIIVNLLRTKYLKSVEEEEYPVHNSFYNTVIHPALQKEVTMNSASWVLSYLLDKTLSADKIKKHIGSSDTHIITDGYFTTTIAYQSYLMKQVSIDKLLQYSIDFDIPKPDFAIYLDVDPIIAYNRKQKEEGHEEGLDIFEGDIKKQKKLRQIFNTMVKENIYCPWEIVDGNGNPDEVTSLILEVLSKKGVI